jgi:hypothetical protein
VLPGGPRGPYDLSEPETPERESAMNEEALNTSLRKFLKVVGVTSQREIETAIRTAVADGRLKGARSVPAKMVLTIEQAGLSHTIESTIDLE